MAQRPDKKRVKVSFAAGNKQKEEEEGEVEMEPVYVSCLFEKSLKDN